MIDDAIAQDDRIFWKLVLGQVNYSINILITHIDLFKDRGFIISEIHV